MNRLLPLTCLLALAACSDKAPEPQAAKADRVATPLDAMKQDEQRARDVQKTVDDQARAQQKALQAAEQ